MFITLRIDVVPLNTIFYSLQSKKELSFYNSFDIYHYKPRFCKTANFHALSFCSVMQLIVFLKNKNSMDSQFFLFSIFYT